MADAALLRHFATLPLFIDIFFRHADIAAIFFADACFSSITPTVIITPTSGYAAYRHLFHVVIMLLRLLARRDAMICYASALLMPLLALLMFSRVMRAT